MTQFWPPLDQIPAWPKLGRKSFWPFIYQGRIKASTDFGGGGKFIASIVVCAGVQIVSYHGPLT